MAVLRQILLYSFCLRFDFTGVFLSLVNQNERVKMRKGCKMAMYENRIPITYGVFICFFLSLSIIFQS